MAKLSLNALVGELHGKLGDLVIRKIRGRYYIGAKPTPQKKPTAGQKAFRQRFWMASNYARHVQRDPTLKAFYEPIARELGLRVRAVAISDWFNPPKIEALDLGRYRGRVGDAIVVRASAKVGVSNVQLRITTATSRQLIETGDATFRAGRWRYTATRDVTPGTTVHIRALARNRPEHPAILEQTHTV